MNASDAGGFDYHLTVPATTDLVFLAFSNTLSLTAASSASASSAPQLSIPINVPANQSQFQQIINIK
jgi:hypothetical protein